jgi:hypothetical protein
VLVAVWSLDDGTKHMHGADPRGCGVLEFRLEFVLANEWLKPVELQRALR